jgi:hypothetical protein
MAGTQKHPAALRIPPPGTLPHRTTRSGHREPAGDPVITGRFGLGGPR